MACLMATCEGCIQQAQLLQKFAVLVLARVQVSFVQQLFVLLAASTAAVLDFFTCIAWDTGH
jgi:hypothetical protein